MDGATRRSIERFADALAAPDDAGAPLLDALVDGGHASAAALWRRAHGGGWRPVAARGATCELPAPGRIAARLAAELAFEPRGDQATVRYGDVALALGGLAPGDEETLDLAEALLALLAAVPPPFPSHIGENRRATGGPSFPGF